MAILPQAVSTVFKEIAFRGYDGDLDVNVLQFWVAVFQVAVNFLCMPVYSLQMLGTQQVPLEEMPNIAVGGSKCLFIGQDQVVENCGLPDEKPCDNCEKALIPAIMRGVREIELDLEEICSRSNRVKENVEKMLDKYSPAYLEDKDATDLMLPTSLKEFWVHQQSTSAHVMGKNEQQLEQRKAYSLYGLWEELSARAEAASSQARMVPSKSYMNLTVFRKDPIDAPKLTGFKRTLGELTHHDG
eukprot:symbB.v1.2.015427.t1/scaffold1143.1/size142617/2